MRTTTTASLVILLVLATVSGPAVAIAGADSAQSSCEYPYTATDAMGAEVTVPESPETVAVLQPSDAQTMWEIGAQDQVVAMPVNQYTGYLEDRDGRTNIANQDGTTNVEAVVGADPDIVLAANVTSTDTVEQLRTAGLTVYHFELVESIDGIAEQTQTVGRLTGNCEGASETVSEMETAVQEIENAVEDRDRPRVLYYSYGFTTGTDTHIHDMIEAAGGQNIAAETGLTSYAEINAELVAENDPQWLLLQEGAPAPSGAPYNETTAVTENQVLRVDANYLSQPAPRSVIALQTMAEAFHPEAFEDDTPAETASETPDTVTESVTEDTVTESTTEAPVTETGTEATGPGFGLSAALIALVATLLFARRRKGT